MDFGQVKQQEDVLNNVIENLNAEKLAIDQLYLQALKDNVQYRKQCILFESQLNKGKEELLTANKKAEELNEAIQQLKRETIPVIEDPSFNCCSSEE